MKFRKKILAFSAAAAMIFGCAVCPTNDTVRIFSEFSTTAINSVSYLDAEGKSQSHSDCMELTSQTTLNAGWYVVNGIVILFINGTVRR